MESFNETERMGLVHRTIAFGLAFATTSFIATSTAVLFSVQAHTGSGTLVETVFAPVRAVFGG
jgi:hypothetical protein